jgi:hypothetical protein
MVKLLISSIIVGMALMSCGLFKESVEENVPEEAIQSLVALGEKPPEFIPGSKFVYKRRNAVSGDFQIYTSTIKSKVNWLGTPAYVIESGREEGENTVVAGYVVIDTNLNTVASLDKAGKLTQIIKDKILVTTPQGEATESPCIKIYDWPLKAGKRFSAKYEILDKTDNKSYNITDQVSVDNKLEEVKLSIGTWTTFKIHRITPGAIETRYYAPQLGAEIKQEVSQTLDNPAGVGVFETELIGYDIPGVGSKGRK